MGRFSRGFKKKAKREAKETMKAQAIINYRKAQERARKQTSVGWGHPEPKIFITPRKKKGEKNVDD